MALQSEQAGVVVTANASTRGKSFRAAPLSVRRRRIAVGRLLWGMQTPFGEATKRTLDLLAAALFFIVFSPLLVLVAVCIKLTDQGSVLYWQQRVGLHGKLFAFPKFRSMVPNAHSMTPELMKKNDHGESITFKMKNDPRVTWVGRWLRRTSIDELPQLWCVITGDMSLVGPRPALPREVDSYNQFARRRLEIKPGLTCFWQVGGRGDLPFPQQLSLDIKYIETRSLLCDLRILFLTVPAVILGRGAY